MNFQFPTLNTGKVPNFSAHKNPTGRQTSREIKWLRKYGTLDLLSRFLRDTCARKTRGKENQSCGKVLTGEIYLTIDNILFHRASQFRPCASNVILQSKNGANTFFRKFTPKPGIQFLVDFYRSLTVNAWFGENKKGVYEHSFNQGAIFF